MAAQRAFVPQAKPAHKGIAIITQPGVGRQVSQFLGVAPTQHHLFGHQRRTQQFNDAGDVVFDPFMGSGTTMAAAAVLDRAGYGCEISPAYCDVIVRRIMNLTGEAAMLTETGEIFAAAAQSRGVPVDQALNPRQQDSRAIQHRGPNPFYGPKKAS